MPHPGTERRRGEGLTENLRRKNSIQDVKQARNDPELGKCTPHSQPTYTTPKHYSNVWADLCWAWSINPYSSMEFVQKFIHGAPINKLFGFGGDTFWPTAAYAYSLQARKWLGRALETQVSNGDLAEGEAMDVATRLLRGNQIECFDLSRM